MERDLRKMINGSNEYEIEAILTKIVEQIRIQYPTADMILQIAEQEPRIADRPELAQMYFSNHSALRSVRKSSRGWSAIVCSPRSWAVRTIGKVCYHSATRTLHTTS
jgi:hypothetical protein